MNCMSQRMQRRIYGVIVKMSDVQFESMQSTGRIPKNLSATFALPPKAFATNDFCARCRPLYVSESSATSPKWMRLNGEP